MDTRNRARSVRIGAMGVGLRGLAILGRDPLLDSPELRSRAEEALYQGAQMSVHGMSALMERLAPKKAPGARATSSGPRRDLFDLRPDEDQQMLVDMLQQFAKSRLASCAEEADEKAQAPEELLSEIGELGLTGAPIPEVHGGAGSRSPVTTVLALEALARADMGLAMAALAPLGVANTIVDQGTEAQQQRWLPALAEERFVPASLALLEPGVLPDPYRLKTTARRRGGRYVLRGEKAFVPLASTAEFFLVAARVDDEPRLFRVPRDAEGLRIRPAPAMGIRAADLGTLVLKDVSVSRSARLGDTRFDYRRVVDLGRVANCALAVGQAQAVVDYCVEYANERHAFGKPISHRQAVAFMLANMAIEVKGMRLLTWRAASRAEQGLKFGEQATLARVMCADKGMEIGTNGVQVLGGHGFVKDHPVERWYRNLRSVGVMEGALSA